MLLSTWPPGSPVARPTVRRSSSWCRGADRHAVMVATPILSAGSNRFPVRTCATPWMIGSSCLQQKELHSVGQRESGHLGNLDGPQRRKLEVPVRRSCSRSRAGWAGAEPRAGCGFVGRSEPGSICAAAQAAVMSRVNRVFFIGDLPGQLPGCPRPAVRDRYVRLDTTKYWRATRCTSSAVILLRSSMEVNSFRSRRSWHGRWPAFAPARVVVEAADHPARALVFTRASVSASTFSPRSGPEIVERPHALVRGVAYRGTRKHEQVG